MKQKDLLLSILWACLALWSLPAAAASFTADLRAYDLAGAGWAVLVSFTGGTFATLLSLMRDGLVLTNTWRELIKDAGSACIAGVFAFVAIGMLAATEWVVIPGAVKVGVLFFSGWARMAFFVWAEAAGKRVADRGADWVAGKMPTKEP